MELATARLVVAGLAGDSGKTLVTLGLCRAARERGLSVQPFKKGPDYIDAAWLGAASGRPCRNLDTFLMEPEIIVHSAAAAAAAADVAIVEGNRGLFDGVDSHGAHSTAELAKLLQAPVVLVVNVTKSTRTVAASVLGCCHLDPELNLAGVILNNVGTERQERVIREAIEEATGVPVVGAVRRLAGDDPLPGRHLGLVTTAEHPGLDRAIERCGEVIEGSVDLERLLTMARSAPAVAVQGRAAKATQPPLVTVGYVTDPAFSFYYPENLEALAAAGARLAPVTPDRVLPELDALYVGGGFPEVHAPRLAEARAFLESLRERVAAGLPVYAECGGLMLLAKELAVEGVTYPMAGVLDLRVEHTSRPQGHGYSVGRIDVENPIFATGAELRGHEFHYSKVVSGEDAGRCVVALDRGTGIADGRDGIVVGDVWASYLHLHALGCPTWAAGVVAQAGRYHSARSGRAVAAWG